MGRLSWVTEPGWPQINGAMEPDDYADYLAVMVFGRNEAPFVKYIYRAYLDLSRTLHTQGANHSRDIRVKTCRDLLRDRLTQAREDGSAVTDQSTFDAWHAAMCADLIAAFGPKVPSPDMSYGHAQKWVNMTLKYLFTAHGLGLDNAGDIATWYPYAHVPIDQILMRALYGDGFVHSPRPRAWSTINQRDYIDFQMSVRRTYVECPMDVEFMLWNPTGGKTPTKRTT